MQLQDIVYIRVCPIHISTSWRSLSLSLLLLGGESVARLSISCLIILGLFSGPSFEIHRLPCSTGLLPSLQNLTRNLALTQYLVSSFKRPICFRSSQFSVVPLFKGIINLRGPVWRLLQWRFINPRPNRQEVTGSTGKCRFTQYTFARFCFNTNWKYTPLFRIYVIILGFNAIWRGRSLAARVLCWWLTEGDVTHISNVCGFTMLAT